MTHPTVLVIVNGMTLQVLHFFTYPLAFFFCHFKWELVGPQLRVYCTNFICFCFKLFGSRCFCAGMNKTCIFIYILLFYPCIFGFYYTIMVNIHNTCYKKIISIIFIFGTFFQCEFHIWTNYEFISSLVSFKLQSKFSIKVCLP